MFKVALFRYVDKNACEKLITYSSMTLTLISILHKYPIDFYIQFNKVPPASGKYISDVIS